MDFAGKHERSMPLVTFQVVKLVYIIKQKNIYLYRKHLHGVPTEDWQTGPISAASAQPGSLLEIQNHRIWTKPT